MNSFITGIDGFIGTYLAKTLIEQGDKVSGLSHNKNDNQGQVKKYQGDLTNKKSISQIIERVKPDKVFHLAAQSNIPYSFLHPQETINTNIIGTLNLIEAVHNAKKEITLLSVGSSAEYGQSAKDNHYLSETSALSPSSPYGISKAAQGQLVTIFSQINKLKIIHVRPFAIIGAGKTGDAVSDFARGIVAIERGEKKYLSIGNLSAIRDFMDVRDASLALELIANKAKPSFIYNICSGRGRSLKDVLDILSSVSTTKIEIEKDSKKPRPLDDPIIVGNPDRLYSLGFKPKYSLEEALSDILKYWRNIF